MILVAMTDWKKGLKSVVLKDRNCAMFSQYYSHNHYHYFNDCVVEIVAEI